MKGKSRILMICDLTTNCGPANINKKLQEESKIIFWDTKKHRLLYSFRKFLAFIRSDVIISSSNYRVNYMLYGLAYFLRKKTIYIMHGYNKFEHKINNTKDFSRRETKTLNRSTLLLPVSEKYMEVFLKDRPEYIKKTHYLMNGIKEDKGGERIKKNPQSVIVSGGNTRIKKNKVVYDAINELNNEGYSINLSICGPIQENGELLHQNEMVRIEGKLSVDDFKNKLLSARLFVLNSELESFSIATIEAIQAGCNVLISNNAGILSILDTKEMDIIYNNDDISEMKRKILYNLRHSNNTRIASSVDYMKYSWSNVARRLEKIANYVSNNESFEKIKQVK